MLKGLILSTLSMTLAEVGLRNGSIIEVCKVICSKCSSGDPDQAASAWTPEKDILFDRHLSACTERCRSCGRGAICIYTERCRMDEYDCRRSRRMIVPLSEDEFQAALGFQTRCEIDQFLEDKPPCKFLMW